MLNQLSAFDCRKYFLKNYSHSTVNDQRVIRIENFLHDINFAYVLKYKHEEEYLNKDTIELNYKEENICQEELKEAIKLNFYTLQMPRVFHSGFSGLLEDYYNTKTKLNERKIKKLIEHYNKEKKVVTKKKQRKGINSRKTMNKNRILGTNRMIAHLCGNERLVPHEKTDFTLLRLYEEFQTMKHEKPYRAKKQKMLSTKNLKTGVDSYFNIKNKATEHRWNNLQKKYRNSKKDFSTAFKPTKKTISCAKSKDKRLSIQKQPNNIRQDDNSNLIYISRFDNKLENKVESRDDDRASHDKNNLFELSSINLGEGIDVSFSPTKKSNKLTNFTKKSSKKLVMKSKKSLRSSKFSKGVNLLSIKIKTERDSKQFKPMINSSKHHYKTKTRVSVHKPFKKAQGFSSSPQINRKLSLGLHIQTKPQKNTGFLYPTTIDLDNEYCSNQKLTLPKDNSNDGQFKLQLNLSKVPSTYRNMYKINSERLNRSPKQTKEQKKVTTTKNKTKKIKLNKLSKRKTAVRKQIFALPQGLKFSVFKSSKQFE